MCCLWLIRVLRCPCLAPAQHCLCACFAAALALCCAFAGLIFTCTLFVRVCRLCLPMSPCFSLGISISPLHLSLSLRLPLSPSLVLSARLCTITVRPSPLCVCLLLTCVSKANKKRTGADQAKTSKRPAGGSGRQSGRQARDPTNTARARSSYREKKK